MRTQRLLRKSVVAHLLLIALFLSIAAPRSGAQAREVVAASGARFALAGTDVERRADQIVLYTPERYQKSPPNAAGVDVLIVADKVAEVRDRAEAVYLKKQADPGPLSVGKDAFVLSANGAARKWVLANLRIGEAVKIVAGASASSSAQKPLVPGQEVAPDKEIPCFPGAFYRKAVSSFDVWTGIGGIVKLPTPKTDPARINEKTGQPLDNFSIYMGGRAGEQEIDAGLTWEFTLDEKGERSKTRNAFRPFWRNEKWNSAPAKKEFYWQPGDTVAMAVVVTAPGKLRLYVSDATPQPARAFSVEFDAAGFQPRVLRQFKRVNAIDQFGNEGRPAQPTAATATGAIWQETFLFRGEGASAQRLAMTPARMTDMRCPATTNVTVRASEAERARGGESIDITGAAAKN